MPLETCSLFLLGVVAGSTVCSLSCLALLTPLLVGNGNGFKDGMAGAVVFMTAKMIVYGVLGGLAGGLGQTVVGEGWPVAVMAVSLVAAGLLMPFQRPTCCGASGLVSRRLPLFWLGMSTSLVPCPQLVAVLALAARQGGVGGGTVCGLVYGAGLMFSPIILAAGGLSHLGRAIRSQVQEMALGLRWLAAMVMVSMGLRLFF